jgi:TPP-dependent pyruvate/acetoin dehydrogenase alpha subunit
MEMTGFALYEWMLKSRLFEEMVSQLWHEGIISGEMHLGTGEEAIAAGIVSQLIEGDAMALDHRGTPPLIMRGVDPLLILKELLGAADGLCGGQGGHMHLFSPEKRIASSGIVGASGPTAAGFALSAKMLRPGTLSVAFFGDGAMNQGMLLESMNLASVWKLPVLFVCKDDGWSITTKTDSVTGGTLADRVQGFGIRYIETDGWIIQQVQAAAAEAVHSIREGEGPVFLRARCVHLEGHFLGYQLLRVIRKPMRMIPGMAMDLTRSLIHKPGDHFKERLTGLKRILTVLNDTIRDPRGKAEFDPVFLARKSLEKESQRLRDIEEIIKDQMAVCLAEALKGISL